MEYKQLGLSGINVSRICLGCMGFGNASLGHHGWILNEEQATEIIKAAWENGINFFDTAMGYADGTSEVFLGRAIKNLIGRKNTVIATKFLPRTEKEIAASVSGQKHIANCLNASLKRLDTDYVDLYICHMWDYHTPIEEIMCGLDTAVRQGKARAVGISNCYAWQLEKANAVAERNGWVKFVSVQGHYNLLFREEEREMIPCCEEENVALTPYSPLASGRLVKAVSETTPRLTADEIAKSKYDNTKEQDGTIIARVAELAKRKSLTRTQVALGWILRKVTAPIVGATKVAHIEDAVGAVGVQLTAEEIAYLEELYVPHKLVGVMDFNHK